MMNRVEIIFLLFLTGLINQVTGSIIKKECISGDKIPMPGDCSRYFRCLNGEYKEYRCKRLEYVTHFDMNTKECIEVAEAKCFRQRDVECEVGEKKKIAGQCKLYKKCFTDTIGSAYGKWFDIECHDSLLFDSVSMTCTVPEIADCIITTTSTITTSKNKTIIIPTTTTQKPFVLGDVVNIMRGHIDWVTSLAYLSTEILASGSKDNTIKIWDKKTGSCIRTLTGHADEVLSLTTLENQLVSCSKDRSIKIWDVETGVCTRTIMVHSDSVNVVVKYGPVLLASGSEDKTIKIWNLQTGQEMAILTGHESGVTSITVLLNGSIASGAHDGKIKIWKWDNCLRTLIGHGSEITSLAVLDNGLLVSSSKDLTIMVWNPNSGQYVRTLFGHKAWILTLAVLNNGLLASGSSDNSIKIWNADSGECVATLNGHSGWVLSLESLDNEMLASSSTDFSIKIWYTALDKID